jgi:serine/threonine protein kinase
LIQWATAPVNCLAENTILQFVQGALPPPEQDAAERHADVCAACLRAIAEAAKYVFQDASQAGTVRTRPMTEALAPGQRVSRYVLGEPLGVGGMGIVYEAHDPKLDRKIALKVLRAESGEDAGSQARLVREAQAMARLSHPNVVAVYDVGEHAGRVFVAMELIEGRTLAAWLADAPRSWREVVEMLAGAGRGLAAAHAAGLVHRDFKPPNVLIGGDGRARVTDFGLARPHLALPDATVTPTDSLLASYTQTGSLAGTPAYMAPEQFARAATDARTDQFSYCVTLYEALYGERPFDGDTLLQLAESVAAGTLRPRPKGHAVPEWLDAILVRGLAVVPAQRFPSLAALLAEIDRHVGRGSPRGVRVAIAAAATTAVAAGIALALTWSAPPKAAADPAVRRSGDPANAETRSTEPRDPHPTPGPSPIPSPDPVPSPDLAAAPAHTGSASKPVHKLRPTKRRPATHGTHTVDSDAPLDPWAGH